MYDNVDWYEVLGISPEATDDDIRQAWRKKVKVNHPDTNGATSSEVMTRLINIAKDILLDRSERLAFDLRRDQWKRQEEEAKRQEKARRQRRNRQERITRESKLEALLRVERGRREEAEKKLRGRGWYDLQEELLKERELRAQAERKLSFEEEFNSDYRRLYNEQLLHTEQAEGLAGQYWQRAERAEARVEALEDLLEDLQRDVDVTFFETVPYIRPFRRYDPL